MLTCFPGFVMDCSKSTHSYCGRAEIKEDWRSFLYLPYMHSESKEIQEVSIQLFTDMGGSLKFAEMHKKIIDQFRRYPHRNEILGRESTPEEVTFLKGPNSSF